MKRVRAVCTVEERMKRHLLVIPYKRLGEFRSVVKWRGHPNPPRLSIHTFMNAYDLPQKKNSWKYFWEGVRERWA